ncbi:hypothetical protein ACFQ1L_12055 [Phytohabitans flavus]|uniref:hypothetical protein n=1 Tax=Phytohabitans flavus TaxID=1076124 RepID=UPI003633CC50
MPRHPQVADPDSTETFEPTPEGGPGAEKPKRRRRTRRIVLICLLVVALLAGGGLLAGGLYVRSVEGSIERVDAFQDVPEESRPQRLSRTRKTS